MFLSINCSFSSIALLWHSLSLIISSLTTAISLMWTSLTAVISLMCRSSIFLMKLSSLTSTGRWGHTSCSCSASWRRGTLSPQRYRHSTKAHTHSSFSWWSKWRNSPSHSQPSFFLEQRTFNPSTLHWSFLSSIVLNCCLQRGHGWPDALTRPIHASQYLAPQQSSRWGSRYGRRQTGHVIDSGMDSTNSHSYPPTGRGAHAINELNPMWY